MSITSRPEEPAELEHTQSQRHGKHSRGAEDTGAEDDVFAYYAIIAAAVVSRVEQLIGRAREHHNQKRRGQHSGQNAFSAGHMITPVPVDYDKKLLSLLYIISQQPPSCQQTAAGEKSVLQKSAAFVHVDDFLPDDLAGGGLFKFLKRNEDVADLFIGRKSAVDLVENIRANLRDDLLVGHALKAVSGHIARHDYDALFCSGKRCPGSGCAPCRGCGTSADC